MEEKREIKKRKGGMGEVRKMRKREGRRIARA